MNLKDTVRRMVVDGLGTEDIVAKLKRFSTPESIRASISIVRKELNAPIISRYSGTLYVGWTDERVEQLRKLWNEGLSATTIAVELGGGITRNAVIGKIHRLGLSQRAKPPIAPQPRVAKPSRQQATTRSYAPEPCLPPMPVERIDREEIVIPLSERVTLVELQSGQCKFPVGRHDDEWLFCGRQARSAPYCAEHSSACFSRSK